MMHDGLALWVQVRILIEILSAPDCKPDPPNVGNQRPQCSELWIAEMFSSVPGPVALRRVANLSR
jgi:hypothetical protein